jgi:hypothetical protein
MTSDRKSPAATIEFDQLPIRVRGFVPPTPSNPPTRKKRKAAPPSDWTLIFDCETKVDAGQNLRFGAYQVRKAAELMESGLFYDSNSLTATELDVLRRVAAERGVKLRTRDEFVDEVLYAVAYDFRANIVGFNLPFDLSRLAIRHGSARGKTMKGGFTFQLSSNPWKPRVQIRHLNARASLMQFALQAKQRTSRGARRRGIKTPGRRGAFIDLKTAAAALFSRSFDLASLADFLKTKMRKLRVDEHGAKLTPAYVAYALQDVQATWECFEVLVTKYELHQLSQTHLGKVLSEASLGKAYLKEMGIQPFLSVQPNFPSELMGIIMSTYYGGRSEVHSRRIITQVLYCDFLSMYPTVCTLMDLWRFVIAERMTWNDTTTETKEFLEQVSLSDLQKPEAWKALTTLVKVRPDGDILPVRAKYCAESQTIGLNFISSEKSLWYTLADAIASKLLTGKPPRIEQAITFVPGKPQCGLQPICIAGKHDFKIEPTGDDFYKRLIDLRSMVKVRMRAAEGQEKEELDAEQQALKILANSTSYGIFVEVNVGDLDKTEKRECYGPSGTGFSVETNKNEEPGRYFHPLLATLITGAARLMLSISETLAKQAGLDWAFCDTDSMALSKPDDMDNPTFFSTAQAVCNWFKPLNPYEKKGPLFKIEDANFGITPDQQGNALVPLYCLCISSKRYVLFNLTESGERIIRKASAHGLGHLLPPYRPDKVPTSIPAPKIPLLEIGVDRWQYDLWHQIIHAELAGHLDQVDLSYHAALEKPAASRYGATTPELLRWFKTYNQNRSYQDQVKPFNFLISFQARPQLALSTAEESTEVKRGRRPKRRQVKPVAPFDKDIGKASRNVFDREEGGMVPSGDLKTYREALAQYHLSPESKFLNGDFTDHGRTERRHVQVAAIIHIGKEADKWEEQFYTGVDEEAQIEYGVEASGGVFDERIRVMREELGERKAARRLEVSRMTLRKALAKGCGSLTPALRNRIGRNGRA